jgi:hypothetical protein
MTAAKHGTATLKIVLVAAVPGVCPFLAKLRQALEFRPRYILIAALPTESFGRHLSIHTSSMHLSWKQCAIASSRGHMSNQASNQRRQLAMGDALRPSVYSDAKDSTDARREKLTG